jgi:hypothetical protein
MVKPAGANAFEAGVESIQADFYLLLIGEKKGRTYSEADGTSVTQQEYREAYMSVQARGRLFRSCSSVPRCGTVSTGGCTLGAAETRLWRRPVQRVLPRGG